MLEEFVKNGTVGARLRASLFAPYLDSFVALVSRLGYARATIQRQLGWLADVGRSLTRGALAISDLEAVADRCLRKRLKAGGVRRGDAKTLRLFVDHLRAEGVLRPPAPAVDASPVAVLKTRYEQYLRRERGLSPVTGGRYWWVLRRFLRERFGDGPVRLSELTPDDVTQFLLRRHAQRRTPKVVQLHVTALRSFLRFLFLEGDLGRDLSAVVPTVRSWRLADIPKFLKAADIDRLLQSCNRTSLVGRRNYAVLLLLARLGLRAGEVVRLELGDLDWRAGELTVRGKGSVHDRLPLPREVGEALAVYLRTDRPSCTTRRVFLRTRAPHRGLNHSSTVSTIVRRALDRVGLTPPIKGAHVLRHSLATELLRRGASLAEIGEVLRHQTPQTTAIYAKVDLEGLRPLARPWPTGGGAQ